MAPRPWSVGALLSLFVILLSLITNRVFSQDTTIDDKTRLKNFIKISQKTWPPKDSVQSNEDHFFFFHNEYDPTNVESSQRTFKPDILKDRELVNNFDFYFKHWTDSSFAILNPISEHKNDESSIKKLFKAENWTPQKVTNINSNIWNNMKLKVVDVETSTLALKDISLQFIEKIRRDNGREKPISDPDSSSKNSKFEQINLPNSLQVLPKNGKFNLKTSLPSDQFELSFQLMAIFKKTDLKNFTLKNLNSKCQVTPEKEGVSCTLAKNGKVISLNVQVVLKTAENYAFIIHNAKLTDSSDVTFMLEDPSDEGEIYVVNPTDANITYTTLFDQQPLDQSQCYHILRPKNMQNSIGVYFKLEPNALLEQKLFESSADDSFCLDHFIALRNLANYTLTLAIEGPIKEEISFGVKREKKAVSDTFQLKNIEQSNSEKSVEANQWFITPQQKNFDFKFSFVHTSDVQVFACDILANCFEYEAGSQHFTLAKQYQDALRHSPYFRIQRDDKKPLENVVFTYQAAKDALEQINKDLSKAMKNIASPDTTEAKYTFALKSGERQMISLPLNVIDLRLNHLEVKLEGKGNESTVPVSVNNIEYQDSQSIQNLSPFFLLRTNAQTNGIILDISTEELFYVERTQTERIGGSLNIELLAEENSDKTKQQIELTLSVNNVDTAQPDQTSKISQKYSIFPQPKESSAILSKDNPRMLISGDLLRSPASRRLLTHNASIAFQMTDSGAPNRTYPLDLVDMITIKRLVMSGGSITTEQMYNVTRNEPSDPKSTEKSYKFEDNYDGEEVQGGAFVLAYLLEFDSRDETNLSVEVRVSDFEIVMPERKTRVDFDEQAGTVVAGSEPDYDPPNCPSPLLECGESFDAHDFAYLYKRQTVRCELPACNNIFTSPLLFSRIYYENQSEKRKQFLPFKMSRQSSSFIELKRTKFDIEEPEPISAEFDFCVKFKYYAKNQPLLVAVNELDKGYQISFPAIDKLSGENMVCASWLRPDVRTVDRLLFAFAEEVISVDEHYVQITKIDSNKVKLGPEQSCLKEGIQHDMPNLASAFLQHSALISIKDKSIILQNSYPESVKETYFLRTKWIPSINTAKDTVRVGLQALSGNITSNFLRATFTISSPEENNIYIETDLSNLKTETSEVNVLQLKKKVDYFQLNFRFEVDYSVMEEHEKLFNVKMTQLVINDACAPQEPNAAKCENEGKCVQTYSNYSTACDCKNKNWYGKLCEFEDFCHTKNGISKCLGKKCENNNEWQTYMCKCEQNQRYDLLSQGCVPNEIDCQPNFVYNVRSKKCDNCAYGFVKNRLQNGTALCEPFDLCNEKHRITRYMSRVPCHDRRAQCRVVSNAQDSNEDPHECICPAEKSLYNQYGRRDASAICARKECELCAQECVNKNDGWSCTCNDGYNLASDGHNCEPKNGTRPCELRADSPPDMPKPFVNHEDVCVCPTDFIYRNQSCEFEQYKWISRFRCPTNTGVEMNAQDHLPGCVCKSGQRFNPITRGCDDKCDIASVVNCATAHNAHGCEFKNGSPTCVCDSSSFPFAESEDKLDQWKCRPFCELLQEQAENRPQCNIYDFEYCDSTRIGKPDQIFVGLLKHNKLNEVFVHGNSSVKINHNDYCKCETNFVRDNDKCIPKGLPIRYIQEITFNANPAMKGIDYSSKMKKALMMLVGKLFDVKSDENIEMETGCERSSSNEIKCHTAFVSGFNESVVKSRLIDSCIPIDSTSCVYLIESGLAENLANLPLRLSAFAAPPSAPAALGDSGLLLRQIDAPIKTSTMRYCEKSTRCARYQYTRCENVEKENGYNCVCDQPKGVDDLFNPEAEQYLDDANKKYKMEQCAVIPLCNAEYCSDKKAECQEFVEHNSTGIWVHHRICQCPDSDKPLRDPTDLCDQSPKPSNQCAKLTKPCSGHGHCVDAPNEPKKFVCTCTAGWSGEICNVEVSNDVKKESDDDDVPKGYMIATIILAIVAALAIVALAIFYFRRK